MKLQHVWYFHLHGNPTWLQRSGVSYVFLCILEEIFFFWNRKFFTKDGISYVPKIIWVLKTKNIHHCKIVQKFNSPNHKLHRHFSQSKIFIDFFPKHSFSSIFFPVINCKKINDILQSNYFIRKLQTQWQKSLSQSDFFKIHSRFSSFSGGLGEDTNKNLWQFNLFKKTFLFR